MSSLRRSKRVSKQPRRLTTQSSDGSSSSSASSSSSSSSSMSFESESSSVSIRAKRMRKIEGDANDRELYALRRLIYNTRRDYAPHFGFIIRNPSFELEMTEPMARTVDSVLELRDHTILAHSYSSSKVYRWSRQGKLMTTYDLEARPGRFLVCRLFELDDQRFVCVPHSLDPIQIIDKETKCIVAQVEQSMVIYGRKFTSLDKSLLGHHHEDHNNSTTMMFALGHLENFRVWTIRGKDREFWDGTHKFRQYLGQTEEGNLISVCYYKVKIWDVKTHKRIRSFTYADKHLTYNVDDHRQVKLQGLNHLLIVKHLAGTSFLAIYDLDTGLRVRYTWISNMLIPELHSLKDGYFVSKSHQKGGTTLTLWNSQLIVLDGVDCSDDSHIVSLSDGLIGTYSLNFDSEGRIVMKGMTFIDRTNSLVTQCCYCIVQVISCKSKFFKDSDLPHKDLERLKMFLPQELVELCILFFNSYTTQYYPRGKYTTYL
eukprot:TRINITY_DN2735_c2_g1_i1.p1 TRINITY_DN2735_c2_g1~~TRINITY_DN2735_c2_g1_i1.p1  ORF type:complete len:493 (-),score=61.37 TRINITY_DN2735_c2_g1_i1:22-1476(-)